MGNGGRFRTEPEHLIDGLTFGERLAKVEAVLYGDKRGHKPGLDREHDVTRERVEQLESIERRRTLPWYLRLFVRRKETPCVASSSLGPTK